MSVSLYNLLTCGFRSIRLPVAALLKQFKDHPNNLVRHFDLLYIQQGIDRLPLNVSLSSFQ